MAVVPQEIIMEEILTRLPVKSLVRFRGVCKSWNSEIYNPNFLFRSNRIRSSSSVSPELRDDDDDGDYLLFINCYYNTTTDGHSYGTSILSCKKLSETLLHNYVPYPLSLRIHDIHLVGSINGLVCMTYEFEGNHQFVLWNPTIRLFKKILVPKHDTSPLLYGFGWNSVTNDYKLIAKPNENWGKVVSDRVYSCKTDCWSNMNTALMNSSIFVGWRRHPSVIVNGSPYWCNTLFTTSILKFDTPNNEFTFLKDAPSHRPYSRGIDTNLINLNDCLASIKYNRYRGAAKVYRYDEQHNVWTHVYTIWTHMYTINKYCMNHDELKIHCFKYGGEIVFHGKNHLYLYDPKSREIKSRHRSCPRCGACLAKSRKRKRRGGSHDCQGSLRNGFSYTPSLVALPGMKALHDLHL